MFSPSIHSISNPILSDCFPGMFHDMYEDNPLVQAVKNKDYTTLDALLKEQTVRLEPLLAYTLVYRGIENSIPISTFRTILELSPPPEELLSFHNFTPAFSANQIFSLVEQAALNNRPEHLDALLNRGFSPNGNPNCPGSDTLLCAFHGRSPDCVRRLVREPDLDCSLTPELLSAWAEAGKADTQDLCQCCLAAAPRLIADEAPDSMNGVPIPRQITVLQAASIGNWALTEHLCRRDGLTVEDGKKLMDRLGEAVNKLTLLSGKSIRWYSKSSRWHTAIGQRSLISLLNTAFTACPQLLRSRLPQALLFFAALSGRTVPKLLRPWLDQVPNHKIILGPDLSIGILTRMLSLWKARFSPRWVPVMDPWHPPIPHSDFFPEIQREAVDFLFSHCQIRSFLPRKTLSPLSEFVLHEASFSQLLRQLQPGGLLQMESPQVLLNYCLVPESDESWSPPPIEPQRRQAVLAYIKKVEADYEL